MRNGNLKWPTEGAHAEGPVSPDEFATNRDVILFTHTDLDGVSCALIFKLMYGPKAEVVYCDYDNIDDRLMEYLQRARHNIIFITDIAPRRKDVWERLLSVPVRKVILDHHETSQVLAGEVLSDFEGEGMAYIDIDPAMKSATVMLHYFCLDGLISIKNGKANRPLYDLPMNHEYAMSYRIHALTQKTSFVAAVSAWDSQVKNDILFEDGKYLSDLLWLVGREPFIEKWSELGRKLGDRPAEFELVMRLNEERKQRYFEEAAKRFSVVFDGVYHVGYVVAGEFVTELGNYLCRKFNLDTVVMFAPERMRASVRRRDGSDFNCRIFAECFGGGGHDGAAGFPLHGAGFYAFMEHMNKERTRAPLP